MYNHFLSVKELLNTLYKGHKVIAEIFGKRNQLAYKYDDAVSIMDDNEEIVRLLCDKGILNQNGQFLEIDDQYLQFFEQVLGVNEEINTAYVNEHIRQLKDEFMLYYLQSDTETERYKYLKLVKNALRKIGKNTTRNIIDLNRNIENAFKTEPNYKIKLFRLENFKVKLQAIQQLIEETEKLINEDEITFFIKANDPELKYIKSELRLELTYARQNLIETRKQIIEYINQIKYQSKFLEKLRQLKYLKDQYELKHKTNILEVLNNNHSVVFDVKPYDPVKLSLDLLNESDIQNIISKLANNKHCKGPQKKLAEDLSKEDMAEDIERTIVIDLYSVMDKFSETESDLLAFLLSYDFVKEIPFAERLTIYCQMASIFDGRLEISDEFRETGGIEYALVYNQKSKMKEMHEIAKMYES